MIAMSAGPRILVIEDDQAVRLSLRVAFERQGFLVDEAATGSDGLERIQTQVPDVVILDLMLPDVDGIELFRRLRQFSNLPVVMLTARGDEMDRITGLELGADDYVTKPFSPRELIARIRAVLRRGARGSEGDAPYRFRDLVIDAQARTVAVGGRDVVLTRTEFNLLAYLAHHAGSVATRDELVQAVWGYVTEGESRLLDSHIRHLRAKIEPEPRTPRYVLTVRDVGYKLRP